MLSFATAADTDYLAYVYARVCGAACNGHTAVFPHAHLPLVTASTASLACAQIIRVLSPMLLFLPVLQWRSREGIEKHLGAQHTRKFLDHVKVMPANILLSCMLNHACSSVLLIAPHHLELEHAMETL